MCGWYRWYDELGQIYAEIVQYKKAGKRYHKDKENIEEDGRDYEQNYWNHEKQKENPVEKNYDYLPYVSASNDLFYH